MVKGVIFLDFIWKKAFRATKAISVSGLDFSPCYLFFHITVFEITAIITLRHVLLG